MPSLTAAAAFLRAFLRFLFCRIFRCTHHRSAEHSVFLRKTANAAVMLGDAFYRLRAQPRPVMLGGAKCSVIFMPQRSREGVVYRYAKRVAGFLCTDNYFSAAFLFRLAGRYCVFYQVAEQDGYIGVGNKNIARYIRLYNIFDTVILCLLRKFRMA